MSLSFSILPTNAAASDQLDSYIRSLGLPDQSLGLLENVVRKLACIQNTPNIELKQLRHLVFAADHGVYDRTHQTNNQSLTTSEHAQRILSGRSPLPKACLLHDVDLTLINCGLNDDDLFPHPNLHESPISRGTRDFSMMPAMSPEQLTAAVQIGIDQASLKLAEGAKVLSFGALGLGNTTSAAAITIALLGMEPNRAVNNQNKHQPDLQKDKVDVLVQAVTLHREQLTDGWSVIQHLGGFEIAAIMGAMLATAELGGMILVDGFACSAALLALHKMYPNITDYTQFTHQSSHLAQQNIMKHLNQSALLNLRLALGEGTGSVLAWPLINTAVSCLKR